MRRIVNLEQLVTNEFPALTKHQVYKAVRRSVYPLPHKKLGKRLLFDVEKVLRWFDGLPGKDIDEI
jgi:hypothetical protein